MIHTNVFILKDRFNLLVKEFQISPEKSLRSIDISLSRKTSNIDKINFEFFATRSTQLHFSAILLADIHNPILRTEAA